MNSAFIRVFVLIFRDFLAPKSFLEILLHEVSGVVDVVVDVVVVAVVVAEAD